MGIDIDQELKNNIGRVLSEKNYSDEIQKYIVSIVSQLRTKGHLQEGDLRDLLENIGNLAEEE